MQQHNRREDVIEMKSQPTVTVELNLAPPRRHRVRADDPSPELVQTRSPNQLPRITRLMALAIKFQEMVERGEVHDYADLARLGHVSRARITQITNLLHLAPDIQEQLIILRTANGSGRILCERHLRKLAGMIDWSEQRQFWRDIFASEVA